MWSFEIMMAISNSDTDSEIFTPDQISKKTKKRSKKIASNKIKGLIFGLIVLIGNGIHPIINNTRPASFDSLNFLFQMSLWEVICAIPLGIVEWRKMKHNPNFGN